MTLPASGPISLLDIQTEFGGAAPIGTDEYYRGGSYVTSNNTSVPTSGAISFSNFYGGSATWYGTISTNQKELNLATWATAQGWAGQPANITIAAGVYIWSDNTSIPALTTGNFAAGLTIINNGYIMGKGGEVSAGGPAISLGCNTTIDNTNTSAYIGGGGGAGGNALITLVGDFGTFYVGAFGGGGAGGGRGAAPVGGVSSPYVAAGAIGASGSNGNAGTDGDSSTGYYNVAYGGGGGRVFPGTGGAGGSGTVNTNTYGRGGSSGGGGGGAYNSKITGTGGTGGSGSAAGGNGSNNTSTYSAGGGGGWGAAGGNAYNNTTLVQAGFAGGKAVALNAKTITWVSGNTTRVYGAVS